MVGLLCILALTWCGATDHFFGHAYDGPVDAVVSAHNAPSAATTPTFKPRADAAAARSGPLASLGVVRAESGLFLATKVGGGGGKKVVIGEDMQGRVIPEARRRGADYYDPPYLPPGQRMGHNRRWMNDRMDEGCTIFDCGPAPGRANFPNPTSRYYQMERDEIARRNYSRYVPPGGGR